MSQNGFCRKCGAPRAANAQFCTACGAPLQGGATAAAPVSSKQTPTLAIAVGVLFVAIGGAAAFYTLREPEKSERAVTGSPSAPAQQQAGGSDLPGGHPNIELPKEVTQFLEGLTAEADKNPQSVDAWQKLTRARYRASVINSSYRASAEQSLAKLLALDPQNDEGLRIAANLAYDGGNFAEAQKRFEAFLAKHPDDASALTDLGSVMLFQDKIDEGVALYQKAIAVDPKFMQARFNLGIAEAKRGRMPEATAALKQAMELASTPDEKQHVENALAEVEGRDPMKIAGAGEKAPPIPKGGAMPPNHPPMGQAAAAPAGGAAPGAAPGGAQGSMQGGMPMPPPAPDREVATNASSDFQKKAEKPLITHPMVGPRVTSFEWTGASSLRAKIKDFPMDQMPPFARAKFKSSMGDKLAAIAKESGVSGPVTVELVDDSSGRVMDTLDSSAGSGAAPSAPPSAAPGSPQ